MGANVLTVKLIQLVIISLVALGFYFVENDWAALSACYGGGVALVYTMLLGWGVAFAALKEGYEQQVLYLSAVIRFIVIALLLILGLGVMKMDAKAAVISFCLAQLAYIVCLGILTKKQVKRA